MKMTPIFRTDREATLALLLACALVCLAATGCQTSPRDQGDATQPAASGDGPSAAQPAPAPEVPPALEPAPAYQDQDRWAEVEEHAKLTRQAREVVVEELVDRAQEDLADGRLEQAEATLREANELLPGHRRTLELLADVQRAMGTDRKDEGIHVMMEREAIVQRDQLRQEAIAYYNKGREAYDMGSYDEARDELQHFLDVLSWSAFDLDLDDLRQPAENLMRMADRRGKEKRQEEEFARRQEAQREMLAQEAREARLKARRIRDLYRKAIDEYRKQNFETSERLARDILAQNPGDRNAERLKQESIRLRHQLEDTRIIEAKVRHWLEFLDDMQEASIPYSDTVVWPDLDHWADITRTRAEATRFEAGEAVDSAAVQSIKSKLDNTRITLEFEDAPLPEVIAFIRDVADVNIVLDEEVAEEFESNGTLISLPVDDLRLGSALNLLFNMHNLKGTYRDNVLYVTSAEKVVEDTVLKLHDIRDLITTLTDFPGASIQLVEPADEEAGGILFGDEDATATFDPDAIVELIITSIAPETWDEDPARFSISASSGNLIVRHTPAVHAEIHKFLSDLRQFAGILVTVEARFLEVSDNFLESLGVDIRGLGDRDGVNPPANIPTALSTPVFPYIRDLVTGDSSLQNRSIDAPGGVYDNSRGNTNTIVVTDPVTGDDIVITGPLSSGFFFQDSNTDIRGRTENLWDSALGNNLREVGGLALQWTLLDDAQYQFIIQAVSKSSQVTDLTSPKLTAFNTQRSNITIANQVSYISDFDVEVAQTSQIADPIVSVIQDGLVLDVRPTVSYDLKYVTLEIRPTVALLLRPISEITTSLGAGGLVTIQLPELVVQSAATTVKVPDGGSILMGGLKEAASQDRKSSTPIVDNIPVLSFFFRKKGRAEELDNLVILVKAVITDMAEREREALRGF